MNRNRGFTLVEMVISIMLIGILGAAAAMAIGQGVRASVESQTRVDTLSKLRMATERMAREIRQVRRDPATVTQYDILTRTSTALSFRRLDNDGTSVRTVSLNGAAPPILTLGYDSPAGTPTLTDQVSSVSFTYWQSDGVTASTTNADLAFIDINLVLNDSFGNAFSQRTRIALRNRQ